MGFHVSFLLALAVLPVSATREGKRLIEFAPGQRQWMTEEEVHAAASRPGEKKKFMDVTNTPYLTQPLPRRSSVQFPKPGTHHAYVESVISSMDVQEVVDTVSVLGKYPTRYYTTETGKQAVEYLRNQYEAAKGARDDVRITTWTHNWLQPSLVVEVLGTDNPKETVVIGGHIDSIAGKEPHSPAPGEDDDASGTATIFRIFEALMKNQFHPSRTVEFHVYAAEEVGLRGSQELAETYNATGRNVVAMVNLDMTGYSSDQGVGIIQDNADSDLNDFLEKVIDMYLDIGYTRTSCGYGCSDHSSWNRYGYPASFPFETPFGQHNPNIHTANDLLVHMNKTHMFEFVKLGVAAICELACPQDSEVCSR